MELHKYCNLLALALAFLAPCELGCISGNEAGNEAGGDAGEGAVDVREPPPAAEGEIPSESDGSIIGDVVHLGAVGVDEEGNIALNPNALAPADERSDAVRDPQGAGAPSTLPHLNGGLCPANAPVTGPCAHPSDQCVYSTPSRTGYCTCIGSSSHIWSCY